MVSILMLWLVLPIDLVIAWKLALVVWGKSFFKRGSLVMVMQWVFTIIDTLVRSWWYLMAKSNLSDFVFTTFWNTSDLSNFFDFFKSISDEIEILTSMVVAVCLGCPRTASYLSPLTSYLFNFITYTCETQVLKHGSSPPTPEPIFLKHFSENFWSMWVIFL